MGREYQIEHYGAVALSEVELCRYLGVSDLETDDFTVKLLDTTKVYSSASRTDAARIAFTKTIEFILRVSDAVVISDL